MSELPPPSCPYERAALEDSLRTIQEQFRSFLALLDQNNQVLKVIGDMEEKAQGDYLFDLNYIRVSLEKIRSGVREIIEQMIMLGGSRYEPLRARFADIDSAITQLFPGQRPLEQMPLVLWFDELGKEDALRVGSKNAQLGELRSRLGLPVPDGFAITAWAYKRFMDENGLQDRISAMISQVDIRQYDDLVRVSQEVRRLVASCELPAELSAAILQSYDALAARCRRTVTAPAGPFRVAVRSSGLGEDSIFSFAGQYATFLNVERQGLIAAYLEVLASKFTPQAIYYFLSHSLGEADLEMSVGCLEMVDAGSSGVIYTQDPVQPGSGELLIHSVFGLGESLVNGTLSPDSYRVSRENLSRQEAAIARKRCKLVMRPDGGTREQPLAADQQGLSSLSPEQVSTLAAIGLRLEQHYSAPQDIEWAIDAGGQPMILQTRPLHVLKESHVGIEPPEESTLDVLLRGGVTACPGAAAGLVTQVFSNRDLAGLPEGIVLVAPTPFPGLITAMGKAQAVLTEVGGLASHMATLAREFRIPTLVGLEGATTLTPGQLVTVDATVGLVVAGEHPELIAAHRLTAGHLFEDTALFQGLKKILALVAPLNLIHPAEPGFTAENCRTLHDITRFAHQRATDEMFCIASSLEGPERLGLELATELPVSLSLIYVDRPMTVEGHSRRVSEDRLGSQPLAAFWAGVRHQGWPRGPSTGKKAIVAGYATAGRLPDGYSVKSYAVLAEQYMMLCLHMGYHFTTVEAMCAEIPSKNYIRLQYKEGGAPLERRIRRIRLVATLLAHLGFDNTSQADFLDASLAYADAELLLEKLQLIGRLVMMTKQLDMALSSDAITQWYTEDFLKQLGLVRRT